MKEQGIPLLPAMHLRTGEEFVEEFLPQLNSRLKKLIGLDFNGTLSFDLDGSYKKYILDTTAKLEELIGNPGESRVQRYHYDLKVGYALEKYVRYASEWEGGSIRGTDFDRKKFTRVFLEAYKHLDNKEAGKFINDFMESFKPEIVDEHFWDLVECVKNKCDPKTVGYFARTLFKLSDNNKPLILFNEKGDDTTTLQDTFANNYVKVVNNTNFELAKAFSRGTKILLTMRKGNEIGRYASTAIDIGKKVSDPMAYWLIADAALLENDDFDYTGEQLTEDYIKIVQRFGKNAGGAYVFGIAGSINNIREIKPILEMWIETKKYTDEHPNWANEAISKINNSDIPVEIKELRIKFVEARKKTEYYKNKYFIPQALDALSKIDLMVFRQTFINLLANMGGSEAALFSKLSYCDQHFYIDGIDSDTSRLIKIPDVLADLKKKMSSKSYSRMIFYSSQMVSHLGIRKICNFIDDVKKCYAEEGEKITLERMSGTYACFIANKNNSNEVWQKIDGLLELRK